MKTTKVKAVFKGQDGSCWYKHGMEYELTVLRDREGVNKNVAIELSNRPNENYCEYESIISFLHNWDCIRRIVWKTF